jgi:hypothetical protein
MVKVPAAGVSRGTTIRSDRGLELGKSLVTAADGMWGRSLCVWGVVITELRMSGDVWSAAGSSLHRVCITVMRSCVFLWWQQKFQLLLLALELTASHMAVAGGWGKVTSRMNVVNLSLIWCPSVCQVVWARQLPAGSAPCNCHTLNAFGSGFYQVAKAQPMSRL